MTEIQTHVAIDRSLCGTPTRLEQGHAEVALTTTAEMAADDRGLVHGGFVFGLADYAAMLAVNHPNVVLSGADVRFTAPVQVGESLSASAHIADRQGRRTSVEVAVRRNGDPILAGSFICVTLDHHVLDR